MGELRSPTGQMVQNCIDTGRLSKYPFYFKEPSTLAECSPRQNRLVGCLHLFRTIYGKGKNGVRVRLPLCSVVEIRRRFKDSDEDKRQIALLREDIKNGDVKDIDGNVAGDDAEDEDADPYLGYGLLDA